MPRFCTKCGAALSENDPFCGRCGCQVQKPLVQPPGAAEVPQATRQSVVSPSFPQAAVNAPFPQERPAEAGLGPVPPHTVPASQPVAGAASKMKWALPVIGLGVLLCIGFCLAYHQKDQGGLSGTYTARNAAGDTDRTAAGDIIGVFFFHPDGSFVEDLAMPAQGRYTVTGDSLDIHYSSEAKLNFHHDRTFKLSPDHRSFWDGQNYVKQ